MGREHWVETTLDKVVLYKKGKKPKKLETDEFINSVPYIDIEAFETGRIKQYAEIASSNCCDEKDVLVVWDGARFGLTGCNQRGSVGSTLACLTPVVIESSYLLKFIQRHYSTIQTNPKGTGIPHVNPDIFWNLEIPLPPLNEQERIVEKLDAVLPRVKSANARLKIISGILKKFRQSVLAAACSGRLTEDWRNESSQVEVFEGLPGGWRFVKMDSLVKSLRTDIRTGPFGSSLKKSEHQKNGFPVWGIESIGKNGEFTGINKIFVSPEKSKELKSFEVKGGDLIISRSGTVGELCILPENIGFGLISTNLMKISLNKEMVSPKYFCWLFEGSQDVIEKMRELCSGSTRLFLTQGILKDLDFPLPPFPEQHEIVRRVEKFFALAHSLEVKYKRAMSRVEKLEQAILAKAFRGDLVEPDPNDEPAAELLKRILAEKAKLEAGKKPRKKK